MQDNPSLKPLRHDALHSDPRIQGVGQWHDARPNIDNSAKAVVGPLMYLQGIARQQLEAALVPYDLTYYEYSVLAALCMSGAPWALSPSTLKTTLLFTSGGLSNLLKRLEQRQFITRSENPRDGRGVLVQLTTQGKHLMDHAMPRVAATEQHMVRMFNARERTSLTRLLHRMMTGNA